MNTPSIYHHMQSAVDIVQDSPHPENKIAASIAGEGPGGENWTISRTNHWPPAIAEHIGTTTKIGNSSGTIHAETACILAAPGPTKGASLFITDPPCPNCMKNMAEAGIAKLYIDHKGFDKDWAKRRGDSFDTMSMRVAAKAGINVFVIYRKEERFEIISRHPPGYQPSDENPATIKKLSSCSSCAPEGMTAGPLANQTDTAIKSQHDKSWEKMIPTDIAEPFALALAQNADNQAVSILTLRHPTIGYTAQTLENADEKYSFIMEPANRALMIAAREGLAITSLYSSRVPTSRELVNIVGSGLTEVIIGDTQKSRDSDGPNALKTLENTGILTVHETSI